ncbi:MAG: prepilin-type N-terminal cleavage/methylation domain-containing protein [Opitutae bacterium]|nr:prepilin-type N-terminal cleavage/methylation domain-containing protein [Opitutae bacterium]
MSYAHSQDCLRTTFIRSFGKRANQNGLTLVEVMVSLTLMATVMLGFIGTFIQSRRVTESSVLHAACTSVVYGIMEQIKQLEYSELLPNMSVDPTDAAATPAPNVRVRINQNTVKWLRVVYTPTLADGTADTPKGPTTTPAASASGTGIGADGSNAIDNWIGAMPLSTVTGSMSQQINLNIWVWIDEIPDAYVSEVKKVTVIYTYSYQDGRATRTVRDREVFLRSRFDK